MISMTIFRSRLLSVPIVSALMFSGASANNALWYIASPEGYCTDAAELGPVIGSPELMIAAMRADGLSPTITRADNNTVLVRDSKEEVMFVYVDSKEICEAIAAYMRAVRQ